MAGSRPTINKPGVEAEDRAHAQTISLAVLNEKLDHINDDIQEIRKYQAIFVQTLDVIRMTDARYPSPEEVALAIKKIERHETYFALMATVVGLAWGLILFIVNKIWVI